MCRSSLHGVNPDPVKAVEKIIVVPFKRSDEMTAVHDLLISRSSAVALLSKVIEVHLCLAPAVR